MGHYILNAQGEAEQVDDLLTWARWYEGAADQRRVARTQITAEVDVSTVFLGRDHSFGDDPGPPVLWETMVFGGPLNLDTERYTSRADAEAGHAAMVERARAAVVTPE